jgi:threonine dehydrogenase-like Zn-dependent dehydrogenase
LKQVLQNYKTGELRLVEVPTPTHARPGQVLVRTMASLVSVGTEKYMLELAQKSLLGKALARPDLVRQVIAKAQAEGILEAWRQAMGRLDTPVPLGYSSAGVVIDVGPGVGAGASPCPYSVGDRVACAGSGYAGHAEVVSVPANLCVKIPGGREQVGKGKGEKEKRGADDDPFLPFSLSSFSPVSFEEAAFVAVGGIALEAVRMARVSLGETVVVIGLGLLGQIAVQLLNAAGCHVIGMDINPKKPKWPSNMAPKPSPPTTIHLSAICRQRTGNQGADAVIILAATPSNEPLEQAAELCRERGRIVAAGLVGLEVPRKPFYDKELELVVSRAWGPGLYDPNYTEKGLDYPLSVAGARSASATGSAWTGGIGARWRRCSRPSAPVARRRWHLKNTFTPPWRPLPSRSRCGGACPSLLTHACCIIRKKSKREKGKK